MIKIYGMIGYCILNNSPIFPNTEILLISDMHSEPIKDCSPYKQINIEDLLEKYLNKNYKILLEEIPTKKELVPLFPESNHVNNTRNLYLKNFDKIIGFDIRLDLIDITLLKYSQIPLIIHFVRLIEFFMVKSKLFELEIIKNYHLELCKKFLHFMKKYLNDLRKKYNEINKITFEIMMNDLEKILSDIIEFYCFCRLFVELKQNISNKYVINCGLYHSENLINIISKYLKYSTRSEDGINKIEHIKDDESNLCITFFDF